MSRIELEQISDNEVEVVLPSDTPMELVQQLTKGLVARGLVEDLAKSTLSVRRFYRPGDKANQVADQLIKSLQRLAKSDELPYWHPKSQFENQRRVREMEIAERRAKSGVKQPTNLSPAPKPHVVPDSQPNTPSPAAVQGATTTTPARSTMPKMYDSNPSAQNSAGGTGKRYAYISDLTTKTEHAEGCKCDKCVEAKKSGKQALAESIRRKASLKKGWGEHLPIPSAEEEIMRLARKNPVVQGDDAIANQLATMMHSKAMLRPDHQQPSSDELLMRGETMGLGESEQVIKSQDQAWGNSINNWLAEATKPISQRFASEEEEVAYWNSIKISDRDDGRSGY